MPPVVTFIGWHDSGKTAVVCEVVRHLKIRGYKVAVLKSSKHKNICFDKPESDTSRISRAGADAVGFIAPDQLVIMGKNTGLSLLTMSQRFFPDTDLVIGEGFKNAEDVEKIEVSGGSSQRLRDQVSGVIAVITSEDAPGYHVFRPDETKEVAEFLEKRYILKGRIGPYASLVINGKKVPLKTFVQDAIARTVAGLVSSLKNTKGARDIELLIRLPEKDDTQDAS